MRTTSAKQLGASDFILRSPQETIQRMGDLLLQDAVGRQVNGAFDPFAFEIVVNLGIGEVCGASEIDAGGAAFVASCDRLDYASQPFALWSLQGRSVLRSQLANSLKRNSR